MELEGVYLHTTAGQEQTEVRVPFVSPFLMCWTCLPSPSCVCVVVLCRGESFLHFWYECVECVSTGVGVWGCAYVCCAVRVPPVCVAGWAEPRKWFELVSMLASLRCFRESRQAWSALPRAPD
jgi:hypothetical protein